MEVPVDQSTHLKMEIIRRKVLVSILVFPAIKARTSKTIPVCTLNCEFRRNSFTFEETPRLRLSVLLQSWNKILLTFIWFRQSQPTSFLSSSIFISPIYTLSMAEKIIVYTQNQGTKKEQTFRKLNQTKSADLNGKNDLSIHFFPQRLRFLSFDRKLVELIRRKWESICSVLRLHENC